MISSYLKASFKIFSILTLIASFSLSIFAQDSGIRITKSNYKHSDARWSPVENLILFHSDMEGKKSIYIIDSKGENLRRLTSLEYEAWSASWSPDGKQIAYSSLRGDKFQIFIYDLVTNTQRRLTSSEFSERGAAWSPDGKRIAYSSRLEGRFVFELFVIDVDGNNRKQLTNNKKSNILPVFSVDGERVFYQSTAGSSDARKPDIFSYHLPTSTIERITHSNTGGGIDPFIYAPNNKLAFFTAGSGSPEGWGTYWIDLETKELTKFDVKAETPGHPTWSYEGKYVTIINRRAREIFVYDIESDRVVNITDGINN